MTDFITQEISNDSELERLYLQEGLILEATDLLCKIMEAEEFSRSDLANALGKSPAFVSQVLNGNRNITLRTLADFAAALGYEIKLSEQKRTTWTREAVFDSTGDTLPLDAEVSEVSYGRSRIDTMTVFTGESTVVQEAA